MRFPRRIAGVKWEPIALMAVLLVVAAALLYRSPVSAAPGARTEQIRIAGERGLLETIIDPKTGEPGFRLVFRGGHQTPITADEVKRFFGEEVYRTATTAPTTWVFRLLNITSWGALAWVGIGLIGQVAFTGRALIQWLLSERKRQSVVPAAFWWLSLIGGIMLFSYFVWRQDLVGVLGQTTGIVIYARNLRLIHKEARRRRRDAASAGHNPADHGLGGENVGALEGASVVGSGV